MKKIIATHLFNDYSGSPLVLATALKNLIAEKKKVVLMTSKNGEGFLSNMEGVEYQYFNYRFFNNKIWRLAALLWSQIILFFKIIKYRRDDVVIYVNTLLPFGAALAGKLIGKKVVYHLHETTVNPPVLKTFLKTIATMCASEAIYVSHFLMEAESLPGVASRVVYNCLSKEFVQKAQRHHPKASAKTGPFTVLMLCSLKEYKGVNEFVKLAVNLPEYKFILVLNSHKEAVQNYFSKKQLPPNLTIYPAQKEVHPFYEKAHLVLNLSHPEKWVETFGMTLLEAMSYGLPVIAPPVGGPVELVEDGYNGYKIDQRNMGLLMEKIKSLLSSGKTYQIFSKNARVFAAKFSEKQFRKEMVQVLAR